MSPKVKTMEGKGVGPHSLAYSTSEVEGVFKFQDGTRASDK
jgi:hypothetical protein